MRTRALHRSLRGRALGRGLVLLVALVLALPLAGCLSDDDSDWGQSRRHRDSHRHAPEGVRRPTTRAAGRR